MTHKLLDYAVYAYAIFWTLLIVVFIYKEKIKHYKFFRFLNNLLKSVGFNLNQNKVREINLKKLAKIKSPGDKEFNIAGYKVFAPSFKEAHKKYYDVKNLKVIYEEVKLKDYVKTL